LQALQPASVQRQVFPNNFGKAAAYTSGKEIIDYLQKSYKTHYEAWFTELNNMPKVFLDEPTIIKAFDTVANASTGPYYLSLQPDALAVLKEAKGHILNPKKASSTSGPT